MAPLYLYMADITFSDGIPMKKTSILKQLKRRYRKFIPFPQRTTWRRWFPDIHTKNLVQLMRQNNIEVVFDIGANTGQFASKLIGAGSNCQIISFEPIPQTHEELSRLAARFPQW